LDVTHWQDWPKPFTAEQCAQLYIQDYIASQRTLSKASGRAVSTIARWSKADDWPGQRARFKSELGAQTIKKTAEKASDAFSEALVSMLESHQEAHSVAKSIALFALNAYSIEANEAQNSEDPERIKAAAAKMDSSRINQLHLVLDRAISGERVATGMDLEQNPGKALEVIRKEGFVAVSVDEWDRIQEFMNKAVENNA